MNAIASIRRTDWFRVIVDLERSGLTQDDIAKAIGRSRPQVNAYKCMPDTEPRFIVGQLLLRLWIARGGDIDRVPTLGAPS